MLKSKGNHAKGPDHYSNQCRGDFQLKSSCQCMCVPWPVCSWVNRCRGFTEVDGLHSGHRGRRQGHCWSRKEQPFIYFFASPSIAWLKKTHAANRRNNFMDGNMITKESEEICRQNALRCKTCFSAMKWKKRLLHTRASCSNWLHR